jgi:fatty-acyl-CoA synthase
VTTLQAIGAALDEDGVRGFCQDRISDYKIPRYIRFVARFPSTVTGKVQKFAMREAMMRSSRAGLKPLVKFRGR